MFVFKLATVSRLTVRQRPWTTLGVACGRGPALQLSENNDVSNHNKNCYGKLAPLSRANFVLMDVPLSVLILL